MSGTIMVVQCLWRWNITEHMQVIDLKQWDTSAMPCNACVTHGQHKLR